MKLAALRRAIGVVFQEGLLFNRAIADNLRIGKAGATDASSWPRRSVRRPWTSSSGWTAASPRASASADGCSPGASASGSPSRALLKDPPILILDEATSALDAKTEAKLLAALDEEMIGRTTSVIAHRLATVRSATRILVFEAGRIVESGTFDELVVRGGVFAGLARQQFLGDASEGTAATTARPDPDRSSRSSAA